MPAKLFPGSRASVVVLSCPVLVLLCVGFVDRAAASLSHADVAGRTAVFDALTHIVDPIPPLAALGDRMALGGPAADGLWRAHLAQARQAAAAARMIPPDAGLARRDPYALRLAAIQRAGAP